MAPIAAAHGAPGGCTIESGLRQRIARLEHVNRREPTGLMRQRLLEPMLDRLKLLERAVGRIDIGDFQTPMVGLLVREAEATCMSCTCATACRRWLDGAAEDDAYRGFCPNAALFDLLPRTADQGRLRGAKHGSAWLAAASRRMVAQLTAWRGRRAAPDEGAFHPNADELRQMRLQANCRELRALLDIALCP